MSTPQFPFGMDPESLRDAPLFRELQRVMSSSSGPVQWELARQLAVAGAAEAGSDPEPAEGARAGLEDALRVAELQVVDFTGLEPANDLLRVSLARRADWIAGAIDAYRTLVESAATRLQDALGRAMVDQLPTDDDAEGPLAALGLGSPQDLIRQLGPLLQATQIGQVFGFLAARVLGDHDVGMPRAVTGPIGFVLTNIERVEADWSLDPREFRTFVALHQVAHRLQAERPWLPAYAARTVDDFLSTMTIDVDAIQQRFASLAPGDPESLQAAFGGEDDAMFGVVLDDEQRLKLDRIRALIGAVEGHADHVATTIGVRLLGTYARIEEATTRLDTPTTPMLGRLLGIEVGEEDVAAGRKFCKTVVELTDEATLTRMWSDADAMPSWPEIEEPRLWLARTV